MLVEVEVVVGEMIVGMGVGGLIKFAVIVRNRVVVGVVVVCVGAYPESFISIY